MPPKTPAKGKKQAASGLSSLHMGMSKMTLTRVSNIMHGIDVEGFVDQLNSLPDEDDVALAAESQPDDLPFATTLGKKKAQGNPETEPAPKRTRSMKTQQVKFPSEESEHGSEIDEETDEIGVISRELPEDYQLDIFDSLESAMNLLLSQLPVEVRAGDLIGFRIHPSCLTITLSWKKNLEPDPELFRPPSPRPGPSGLQRIRCPIPPDNRRVLIPAKLPGAKGVHLVIPGGFIVCNPTLANDPVELSMAFIRTQPRKMRELWSRAYNVKSAKFV